MKEIVENSRLGRSVELDGLAEGIGKQKNHLLVVECKYRKAPFGIDESILRRLETIFETIRLTNIGNGSGIK